MKVTDRMKHYSIKALKEIQIEINELIESKTATMKVGQFFNVIDSDCKEELYMIAQTKGGEAQLITMNEFDCGNRYSDNYISIKCNEVLVSDIIKHMGYPVTIEPVSYPIEL